MNKDDCLREMNDVLPTVNLDFDSVVVVMLDRKTNMLANWWYFSGHPDHWGTRELSSIAQQMTAATAECLKSDSNVAQREIRVKTRPYITGPAVREGSWLLFAIGLCLSPRTDARDRLWLWGEINHWEFGAAVSFYEGTEQDSGKPYWSLKMLIGPLVLRFTCRKRGKQK